MRKRRSMAVLARSIATIVWLAATAGLGWAQEDGPQPWQTSYQTPASQVMEYVDWFSWYTVVIMSAIVLLVIGLIAWCAWRYNERANPVPDRITHNTTVEVLWTVVPVLILVAIAIPSFRLLYGQYDPARLYEDFDPETTEWLTVKVTGLSNWSWQADYDNCEENAGQGVSDPIQFQIYRVPDDQLAEGQPRLLTADNPVVVPIDTFVRVHVTADQGIIHALGLPAFGLKVDAVPGRLNETYFKAEREGLFYGQCSELCGKDHAFMPINFEVVSQDEFRQWAAGAGAEFPGETCPAATEAAQAEGDVTNLAAR
jgi:cytochrome c oxidase subunit II